jgi:nucleotidyltransferase substrate binding protein (TIGR01987 family)
MNEDIRWLQRFYNYKRALKQLKNAVELSQQRCLTDLEAQGLIKSFEYTHELAWKTLKDFLQEKGNSQIYGSKDTTRKAFQLELIQNGDVWMDMIKSRNLSSHTYNSKTVDRITNSILKSYFSEFMALENTMSKIKNEA